VNEYKFYPDNPTSDYHKQKFASKGPSRYYDPCQESANMSVKCLEMNNFDRDMCTEYFKAYRECKKEWMRQRRSDIRSGEGGWS
jgi:cytochrome c oxidase assembly protein subunit 23